MIRKCLYCNKEFKTQPCKVKVEKGKYCSKICYGLSKIGQPSKKDKRIIKICPICNKSYKVAPWQIKKNINIYCSAKCWGISKRGKSIASRGKPRFCNRGENHYRYKGLTPINESIRHSLEYKLWREAVFARDNWTCIQCGDNKGGNLEADHIKPFAIYPEIRFAIDNGRTLCKTCHKQTDTWGWKTYNIIQKIKFNGN